MNTLNIVRIVFLRVEVTSSLRTERPTKELTCLKPFSRSYMVRLWWKREPNCGFPNPALHLNRLFGPQLLFTNF